MKGGQSRGLRASSSSSTTNWRTNEGRAALHRHVLIVADNRVGVVETSGIVVAGGVGVVHGSSLQTATDQGTKTAGQTDKLLTTSGSAGANTGVGISSQAIFQGEQSLQTIAQIFDTLETEAGGRQHARVNLNTFMTGLSVENYSADISDTVDGDVGLGESSGGGQAGNSQSDKFLLHQKISLVVSF